MGTVMKTYSVVIVLGIIRGKAGDDLQDLEGDFLQSYVLDKKGYNEKCPLTMLEMSIKYYEKKNPALMRLKDLKKLYPGDKFSDILDTNDCHNDEAGGHQPRTDQRHGRQLQEPVQGVVQGHKV